MDRPTIGACSDHISVREELLIVLAIHLRYPILVYESLIVEKGKEMLD